MIGNTRDARIFQQPGQLPVVPPVAYPARGEEVGKTRQNGNSTRTGRLQDSQVGGAQHQGIGGQAVEKFRRFGPVQGLTPDGNRPQPWRQFAVMLRSSA